MRTVRGVLLILLLVPVFLVTFTVVHELGHTLLARLLGDPASVFYLAHFEAHSTCLGCNIYDPAKLSWAGNLVVNLGGLFATQLVAVIALLLRQRIARPVSWLLRPSVSASVRLPDIMLRLTSTPHHNVAEISTDVRSSQHSEEYVRLLEELAHEMRPGRWAEEIEPVLWNYVCWLPVPSADVIAGALGHYVALATTLQFACNVS